MRAFRRGSVAECYSDAMVGLLGDFVESLFPLQEMISTVFLSVACKL
jgi:hypothetical protein